MTKMIADGVPLSVARIHGRWASDCALRYVWPSSRLVQHCAVYLHKQFSRASLRPICSRQKHSASSVAWQNVSVTHADLRFPPRLGLNLRLQY